MRKECDYYSTKIKNKWIKWKKVYFNLFVIPKEFYITGLSHEGSADPPAGPFS